MNDEGGRLLLLRNIKSMHASPYKLQKHVHKIHNEDFTSFLVCLCAKDGHNFGTVGEILSQLSLQHLLKHNGRR